MPVPSVLWSEHFRLQWRVAQYVMAGGWFFLHAVHLEEVSRAIILSSLLSSPLPALERRN